MQSASCLFCPFLFTSLPFYFHLISSWWLLFSHLSDTVRSSKPQPITQTLARYTCAFKAEANVERISGNDFQAVPLSLESLALFIGASPLTLSRSVFVIKSDL